VITVVASRIAADDAAPAREAQGVTRPTTPAAAGTTVSRLRYTRRPMSRRDRVILGLLCFYVLIALSLELYWLNYRDELVARAPHELFARLFQIYGDADRAYYDRVTPLAIGLEGINVYFTQILNVLLVYAIVARRTWRHTLQLLLGSYVTYSVILYFYAAHATGYPDMRYQSAYTYFLFYAPNLPWLLGYGYMVLDSIRAIHRHIAAADAAEA